MFSYHHAVWDLACALAETGEFANVTMIEQELSRRGISQAVTENSRKREFLTRACHAARDGIEVEARYGAAARAMPAGAL